MKFIKTICAIGVVVASVNASHVMAKVSPEEAERLGKDLTPLGGIVAGNAEGTIPEWTGGLKENPAGYVVGQPYIDPFPDDKILFTIDQSNVDQYADKLSAGKIRVIKAFPNYKMHVYESRRPARYSDEIAGFAKHNALNTELVDGGNGIKNAEGVCPFPIPQVGLHLVWNHIFRHRGGSFTRSTVQVTPMENGDFSTIRFFEEFSRRYRLKDFAKNKDTNVSFYFKQAVTKPARLAGNVLLVHETLNQVKEPRRAWIYNAGQRRVRRAPQTAYDGPGTASDGLRTTDNFEGFNGAPDRYDWELIGREEMYIPYNSYKIDDKSLKYKDLIRAGHLNTDYTRYELHRVWKVVATLKAGKRHIYSKRVMYIDEDSWQFAVIDHYDGRGELWRHYQTHSKMHYDADAIFGTIEEMTDLLSGRYIALGLANEEPLRYDFRKQFSSKDFTPAALRRSGRR